NPQPKLSTSTGLNNFTQRPISCAVPQHSDHGPDTATTNDARGRLSILNLNRGHSFLMSPAAFSKPRFSPTAAVRNTTRRWMEAPLDDSGEATVVSINRDALNAFASEIAKSIVSKQSLKVAEWDADGWHYTGRRWLEFHRNNDEDDDDVLERMRMERVALYILTLDAINFCFWPLPSGLDESDSKHVNGLEYEHLAIALRKIAEADDEQINELGEDGKLGSKGDPVRAATSYALSPTKLSELTTSDLHSMIQPHFPPAHEDTIYELPNLEVRCQLLNELGRGLLEQHRGSAIHMIAQAGKSADALVCIILDTFPGFRDYVDTNQWKPSKTTSLEWELAKSSPSVVHFYKRAQIAVADIWAALGRHCSPPSSTTAALQMCQFNDMEAVTTFPDYRVPQILRHVEVLQYDSALANLIDGHVELEKYGIDEVSIRAGTVCAVEGKF
ncbi:hypothetical protein ACHAWF_006630, partial [Thalassiosira exigua]